MSSHGKLGLIAGGGGLPIAIAQACQAAGREVFVARLKGWADAALAAYEGADLGLAEFGGCVRALRGAGCGAVCLAGQVGRPQFADLKPDLGALKRLPAVIAAASKGDDAVLRAVLASFELEGFAVEGVGEAGAALLLETGPLGRHVPGDAAWMDIAAALKGARELGLTDVGQAAVARGGRLAASEDRHGTDALLARCAEAFAGDREKQPSGVLAKTPKPGQDRRVDLPTIGVVTLERAAAAGLAGVVGEAGAMLVVDKPAVRSAADRLGLFVLGVEPDAE